MKIENNLVKCYLPNDLLESVEKTCELYGFTRKKYTDNQNQTYDFFIESTTNTNHKLQKIGELLVDQCKAEPQFELEERVQLIYFHDKKRLGIQLTKNGQIVNNIKHLIIFYNRKSNFKNNFFSKQTDPVERNLLETHLDKLNQNKLINFLNGSSYFLQTFIEMFYVFYLCVFVDLNPLRKRARIWSLITNLFFGISFSILFLMNPYFDAIEWMNQLVGRSMELMMIFLTTTLNWLMGVPVGLKLNKRLAEFLGRFFMYHIYLWDSSLLVFKSLLPYLINFIIYSGFFGISNLISALNDVFTLLTIHTTCFYIYANRIYKLELESLKALFRLFRGKKLNPLRKRIDSFQYNIEQLFVGTLGFCVTVFLLPTVLVYFTVFLALRIFVILITKILDSISKVFGILPIYEFVLIFTKSSSFWKDHSNKYMLELSKRFELIDGVSYIDAKSSSYKFDEIIQITEWKCFVKKILKIRLDIGSVINGNKI